MKFRFFVNGEERRPTEEECKKLIHNMLLPLGYEENTKKKEAKKGVEVSV